MEDFIIREINKIGELIRAMLARAGILKSTDKQGQVVAMTKIELADSLNIDIDTLLGNCDFIASLVNDHKFAPNDLELFAELLADLAAAAENPREQQEYAAAACQIYKYQDDHKATASYNRYYILQDLEQYNKKQLKL